MSKQHFGKAYGSKAPENYERFFVPAIGKPLANELLRVAALRPGERVLDVGCGTGIVARLAAQQVGSSGKVAGLDVNPGMLEVAESATPADTTIEWYESSAEEMPLPDETFDVVLCQLSLQFMSGKRAALQEMWRVLVPGGRLILNVPGPTPKAFAVFARAMERNVNSEAAGFVTKIFSLHDTEEIEQLISAANFQDIVVRVDRKSLHLPPSREFLWQYVHSTPLAGMVATVEEDNRAALEQEVVDAWQEFEKDGTLTYQQRVLTAIAHK
jgi:ubiquinone/menaquinone biosynthesis C-methylase UbiE